MRFYFYSQSVKKNFNLSFKIGNTFYTLHFNKIKIKDFKNI